MSQGAVLILGGNSDIARATAHVYAGLGYAIQLAVRDTDKLETEKIDLEIRYRVPISLHKFDVLDLANHPAFIENLPELPEIAICVIGYMPEQTESEHKIDIASTVMRSNYEGPACILSFLANKFENRGSGTIVGISSVAGERGRATNYVYGSAKAGFTAFLSGLRNRLSSKGVHVISVLPGFVATRMTEGMSLPSRLTAQPEEVAHAIENAVAKRKNVIYVKKIWSWIMLVIRLIPEFIFKKLKI